MPEEAEHVAAQPLEALALASGDADPGVQREPALQVAAASAWLPPPEAAAVLLRQTADVGAELPGEALRYRILPGAEVLDGSRGPWAQRILAHLGLDRIRRLGHYQRRSTIVVTARDDQTCQACCRSTSRADRSAAMP